MAEKYTVSNIPIETLFGYIKSGEIAVPEIQRPFVWKPRQVLDFYSFDFVTKYCEDNPV